jgi:hypothetical protein
MSRRSKEKFVPILDGRLVRHTYDGTMLGKPRHGEGDDSIQWLGEAVSSFVDR